MEKKNYQNIDHYISEWPESVSIVLKRIRRMIGQIIPEATEVISYNMPAFRYKKKILVYFAGYKNHIGFYALPSGNEAFRKELTNYKTGRGSIQFPLDKEIPYDLIRQIVMFRQMEIDTGLTRL